MTKRRKLGILAASIAAIALGGGGGVTYHTLSDQPIPVRTKPAQVLYVRAAATYEGRPGSHPVWMTVKALEESLASWRGCPVLTGHDWGDPDRRIGKILDVAVRKDAETGLKYLEMILEIRSPEAIKKIRQGTYEALSIGFTDIKGTCNIDGKDWKACYHRPGRKYPTEMGPVEALVIIEGMRGRELSFVNIPASERARVMEYSRERLELS